MSHLLQSLLNLQQLDDKRLQMEQIKQEIPEQILGREKEFEEDKKNLGEKKKRKKDATLKQRTLEKELEENTQQLGKKESRKFDVKTNEEYRALLKEIEYTKEANSKIEDEILMLFEEIETLEKAITNDEGAILNKEKKLQEEKQQLEQEMVSLDQEYQETQVTRQRVCSEVDAEILSAYEKIRDLRAGQAVVVVHQDVCPGCHLHIPPQTVNEVLQTGEIRYCPHCTRILYCELPEDAL